MNIRLQTPYASIGALVGANVDGPFAVAIYPADHHHSLTR
jgi:hypothetical protein